MYILTADHCPPCVFVCVCVCVCVCAQELECLQDHLEDLVSACREVVGNLTELESEVINIKWKLELMFT